MGQFPPGPSANLHNLQALNPPIIDNLHRHALAHGLTESPSFRADRQHAEDGIQSPRPQTALQLVACSGISDADSVPTPVVSYVDAGTFSEARLHARRLSYRTSFM